MVKPACCRIALARILCDLSGLVCRSSIRWRSSRRDYSWMEKTSIYVEGGDEMISRLAWRRFLFGCALMAIFSAGVIVGQQKYGMPKTVIHVVTLKWTADSTPEQRQKALDGVKTMAATIPGLKNIWLKTIKVQPSDFNAAFVMEFADEAAFNAYADHPKHREWESIYIPIRQESRTHDITN
jgi:hypothetical protein